MIYRNCRSGLTHLLLHKFLTKHLKVWGKLLLGEEFVKRLGDYKGKGVERGVREGMVGQKGWKK